MFVVVLVVPALLVVVVGYVIGHGLWSWLGGLVAQAAGTSLAPAAEAAGWVTGAVLLAVVVKVGLSWLRWSRNRPGPP